MGFSRDARVSSRRRRPSAVQVIVYGMLAGGLAMGTSHGVGKVFFAAGSTIRSIVLAAIAIIVGAAAGMVCDPILAAVNRRR